MLGLAVDLDQRRRILSLLLPLRARGEARSHECERGACMSACATICLAYFLASSL